MGGMGFWERRSQVSILLQLYGLVMRKCTWDLNKRQEIYIQSQRSVCWSSFKLTLELEDFTKVS